MLPEEAWPLLDALATSLQASRGEAVSTLTLLALILSQESLAAQAREGSVSDLEAILRNLSQEQVDFLLETLQKKEGEPPPRPPA